jgi:hypothetical protein
MGFREFDQGITAYQLERQRLREAEMERQLRHSDLEIYLDILRPLGDTLPPNKERYELWIAPNND